MKAQVSFILTPESEKSENSAMKRMSILTHAHNE